MISLFEMINNPNKFFDSMGYGNIVMFAFGSFLCQIFGKCRIPVADILGEQVNIDDHNIV